jgi:hypothetical protein
MRYLHLLLILGLIHMMAAPRSLGESDSEKQKETLRETLISSTWSWTSIKGTGPGVKISFRPGGTVNINGTGITWHWRVTGPHTVHFTWRNNEEFMDATLDEALWNFVCTDSHHRRSVTGGRIDKPPEQRFRETLIGSTWSWNNEALKNRGNLRINFQPGGIVTAKGNGMTWHWRITGPRTVHFTWITEQDFMDATFDEAMGNFVCTDQFHNRSVSGGRIDNSPEQFNRAAAAFEKKLLRTRWTWPGPNGSSERLFLQQGGIAVDPDHWVGHWEIKDAETRTVLIRAPFGRDSGGATREAILIFDEGLTKWSAPGADELRIGGMADGSNRVETLATDFLDITNLILSPIDQKLPGDLRNDIIRLKEGLKDEASNAPQASPVAYQAGEHLCDLLVLNLEQRDAYFRRFRASMGNITYVDPVGPWEMGWTQSTLVARKAIENQYALFRNGVRQAPLMRAPRATPAPAPTQVVKLETPKPALVSPSTGAGDLKKATKDNPLVNSLGMKFVPVADTKVLFSVWDTRVQDYAEYASARGITPKQADFAQESTHPVVNVSWEDAQAFCAWLGMRDGRTYRLPTDSEWSIAVGLGVEKGATPKEKSMNGSSDIFPYGRQWPPPPGAGNYADQTAKRMHSGLRYIDDYDDGYAFTSPVGTFSANGFGLYDMGGNVWQWCEDYYDETREFRLTRGACWAGNDPSRLCSSARRNEHPGRHSTLIGFRCVLELPGG